LDFPDSPWLRVERVALVRREIHESLSSSALDVLWRRAEALVEGDGELTRDGRTDAGRFYATIMVTFDLKDCDDLFRERMDAATAQRVAELLLVHAELRAKLLDRVRVELGTLCGVSPERLEIAAPVKGGRPRPEAPESGSEGERADTALRFGRRRSDAYIVHLDHNVRAEGTRILIDGDAMVSLESSREDGVGGRRREVYL
jgi:hypothetical protein